MAWDNPFANFVNKARAEFRKIRNDPEITTTEMYESRVFVFDVVDRVEVLSAAFERLHELSGLYRSVDVDWSLAATGAPIDYPEEREQARERCHHEAKALVTFAYYELSTLVALMRDWIEVEDQSELKYLIGVRNKILAHPRHDARIKNSHSELWIGHILLPQLVGGSGWFRWIRDRYLNELDERGVRLDDEAGELANRNLILSKKVTEHFTPEERLRLKAYIVREPDLLIATSEMATLLETRFLPEVARVCSARVD